MMNKTTEKQPQSKKNQYQFSLDRGRSISITSKFDNGNIRLIKQQNELNYRLQAIPDNESQIGKKTWFYFKARCEKNIRVRFVIENVSIYENMYQDKNWCRPVLKEGTKGIWNPIKQSFLTLREQAELIIDHTFSDSQDVYFALTTPFSFSDSEQYLSSLKYSSIGSISYTDEIIGKSCEGRPIRLLTIQERQPGKSKAANGNKRPVILITTRVHPGEVSSFYCLMGIIDFLLKPYNLQACLLRKLFTIMIIPTVNPDGVFAGNYRMDTNGVNLNRVYSDPDQQKHPTVFIIKNLMQQLCKDRRIQYHFDLHSHSSYKPAFIYGNALDDIVSQTESELFCRILEQYTPNFKHSLCQFGGRNMKAKDKGQPLTKEGCARVVFSKMANIVNSYTVETSIFNYPKEDIPVSRPYPSNPGFQLEEFCFDRLEKKYQENAVVRQNMELGICLMACVLDHVDKNPYAIIDLAMKSQFRKEIATQIFQNQDRFKLLDIKAYNKTRFIGKYSQLEFADRNSRQWSWLAFDQLMGNAKWPQGFSWFTAILQNRTESRKKLKVRTQSSEANLKISGNFDILDGGRGSLKKRYIEREVSPIAPQTIQLKYLPQIHRQITSIERETIEIPIRQSNKSQKHEQTQFFKSGEYSSGERQKMITLNPLITMKELQLSCVKNNVIMQFIEKQLNKLNERKLKKQLPSFNRLITYKVAMREKNSKIKSSDLKNLAIRSSKRLLQWQGQNQQEGKMNNMLFPIPVEGQEKETSMNERFLTGNEQEIEISAEIKGRKEIIGHKRDIVRQKFNLKMKNKEKSTDRSEKNVVKLPEISKNKLCIDMRTAGKKNSCKTEGSSKKSFDEKATEKF